ncbi:MAG: hypothetical protein AB7U34_01030 [Novosphingobium sp.]
MTESRKLPDGFAELEQFVDVWAKPTVNERLAARGTSSMEEITAFYDATIARGDDILNYLDDFDLYDLPDDAARLMLLLLALVQASVAVEIQRQPLPPRTSFPFHVSLVSGAEPFGTAKG